MLGDMLPTEMTSKVSHAWLSPILSLTVGLMWLGCFPLFGYRGFSFFGLLLGAPAGDVFGSSFPWLGVPAFLAGLFGFLRARPKEIWSYGFLMWVPQAIFGVAIANSPGWLAGQGLVIVVSSLLASVVSVLVSYAGFALHKVVNRIRADPEEPPSILRK